jgi:hypothetical protein
VAKMSAINALINSKIEPKKSNIVFTGTRLNLDAMRTENNIHILAENEKQIMFVQLDEHDSSKVVVVVNPKTR